MKRILPALVALGLLCPHQAKGQQETINDFRVEDENSLIEDIFKVKNKTDKFNLYLNMHADFDASWTEGKFDEGKFKFQDLRIEMKGNINNWLSYRYRHKVSSSHNPNENIDGLLKSIDIAGIGLKFGKWGMFLGKQCTVYGGYEFDYNPIEIYQYCDMIEYMTCFLTGINVSYNLNRNHQFQAQMLNAFTEKSEQMYGAYEKSKMPMVYTLNWNGNFGDIFSTRWSSTYMSETRGSHLWYFALGNKFKISKDAEIFLDWMYTREGVDRKGIITSIVSPDGWDRKAAKTEIMSFVLRGNYHFHPAWNVFAKLMYENEGVYRTNTMSILEEEGPVTLTKGKYRTALGYVGGVEYYPFKDRNLHFFATYIGRSYLYTAKGKAFGSKDYNTDRFQIGFIWQMPVF